MSHTPIQLGQGFIQEIHISLQHRSGSFSDKNIKLNDRLTDRFFQGYIILDFIKVNEPPCKLN